MNVRTALIIVILLTGQLMFALGVQITQVDPTIYLSTEDFSDSFSPLTTVQNQSMQFLSSGFIENRGQVKNEEVLFYFDMAKSRFSFLERGILLTQREYILDTNNLQMYNEERSNGRMHESELASDNALGHYRISNVILEFVEDRRIHPVGRGEIPASHSFFIGNDSSCWICGVPEYRSLIYHDLYEGIDLVCSVGSDGIKYEYKVKPNADPSQIRFHVEGGTIEESKIENQVSIKTEMGNVVDTGLVIYYSDDAEARIDGRFWMLENEYGYDISCYDTSRSIVIDPFLYSTFYGGSNVDDGYIIKVSSAGDIYLGGMTASDNLPSTPGAFQEEYNGRGSSPYEYADVFIAKFGPDGKTLKFSTYLGTANCYDWLRGMEIDQEGNVFLCGVTRGSDFPTTEGAFQRISGPMNSHGFVTKLSSEGTRLIYSTYLGAQEKSDYACGLAIDTEGYAYITGYTGSPNFPTTPGAFQTTMVNGTAYISKLNKDGSSLVYSTLLGGSHSDSASAIALHRDGSVFVTGNTRSRDFPITDSVLERESYGNDDIFISRISKDGDALEYSVVFGTDSEEEGRAIAVDDEDFVYLVGTTWARDFPITDGAVQSSYGGGFSDMVVLKIDVSNKTVCFSSYLGGDGIDWEPWERTSIGFEVDRQGNIYLIGYTNSTDFPHTSNAYQPNYGGGKWDAFVSVIASDGRSFIHSTYLGGSLADRGYGICLDDRSVAIVTGSTHSHEFPTSQDAYQRTHDEEFSDTFIMFFDFLSPIADAGPDVDIDQHETVVFNGTGSTDNVGIENWTWSFDDGRGNFTLFGPTPSHVFHEAGNFTVVLNVTDASGNWAVDWMNVTVRDSTRPIAVAGPDIFIDQSETAWFDGSSSWDNEGIVNYSWSFEYEGRAVQLDGVNASFRFDEAGVFVVELKVFDAEGNWAVDYLEVWVRDVTGPLANAGPDVTTDQHQTVAFDGTGSSDNVGVVDWVWKFRYNGTVVRLYGPTPVFVLHKAGVYVVTLEVFDAEGNRASDDVLVTVRDITPPVADAGPDKVARQGELVPFNGSGSWDDDRIVLWNWTLIYRGVFVKISGERQFFVFQDSGEYEVALEVTDASGNVGRDMFNVTVLDVTPPRADAGPDRVVELGQQVILDGGGSSDDAGVAGWTWSFEDGAEVIRFEGVVRSYLFGSVGEHIVVLNVTDGAGNWATDVVIITVVDAEDPMARAGEDVTVVEGGTVRFNGLNSSDNLGIVSYSWLFEYNGTLVVLDGGAENYTFWVPGSYRVHLRVTDAAGNSGTDSMIVTVLPLDDEGPQEPKKRTDVLLLFLIILFLLLVVALILYLRYRKRI